MKSQGSFGRACIQATVVAASLAPALAMVPGGAQAQAARFIPDVVTQFDSLTIRPDALGFDKTDSPNPTKCKHYQGIVRVDARDGTPYFYVTRSGNIPPVPGWDPLTCADTDDDPGNFLVVRMGSRDKHGERLRSNRISRDLETEDTPPEPGDTTVAHFTFDGATGDWPNYGHPGGMQAIGDVVAVALEAPRDSSLPDNAVLFLDVSERESPRRLSLFDPCTLEALSATCADTGVPAGLVGLTPLADGRYLMVVTGGHNEILWFFESVGTDLKSPDLSWTFVDTWTEAEDGVYLGAGWHTDPAHQTLNFLREGSMDGTLYLAGARGKYGVGEDHLDLYRVDRVDGEIKLKFVSNGHKESYPALDGTLLSPGNNVANFAAASAFYVSPSGELIFYATEHDNDGPEPYGQHCTHLVSTGDCLTVKMGEWRHVQVVRPGSTTYLPSARVGAPAEVDEGSDLDLRGEGIPAITRAWAQLWSDENFGGRYLVMDYDDRLKDDFHDFKSLEGALDDDHFGFDNEASSMLAYAPVGCTIRVNDDDIAPDDDYADPGTYTRTLRGTGTQVIEPYLSQVRNDSDTGSIDEELTSAQFFKDCAAYYSAAISLLWDLEDDGIYDVSGNVASVSGALTDGPDELAIRVRATHPTDTRSSTSLTRVTVRNVAPTITAQRLVDGLGQVVGTDVPFVLAGLPFKLEAGFADPGRLDWQIAAIAWGDDSVSNDGDFDQFRDGYGSGLGTLAETHTFAAAGEYTITLHVEDDDGGVATRSTVVTAASPYDAILTVIEAIDALLADKPPRAVAKALAEARRLLDGDEGGADSNGAIDKLDPANVQAALVKLAATLEALKAAEDAGAGDLSELSNILILVIQQLESSVG